EAYLVGGGVRDLLLGKKPKDFDVTTSATPEQVRKLFRNCRLVARREALEEAGLIVGRTKPVLSYLASPGGTSERLSIMVGEVDATTADGIHGLADENEDIRVHVVSREQAYQWVEEGKIDNAASVIALQWLQLHYQTLRNEWKK
ncbi:hypothetical protein QUG40_19830, partial [Enterobacter cloacae]|nr:hypothetical protein [Enterobacter cloacae]